MNIIKACFLSLLIFLIGCNEKPEITEIDNPEEIAVAFFDAIYNQKDVKKAASVCTPKLARIIMSYKSPEAVARHMFNMKYDKVEIKPDDSGVKVREQFKGSATITLYFDGYYFEDRLKDVKRISLVQSDKGWVINKLLKDPF